MADSPRTLFPREIFPSKATFLEIVGRFDAARIAVVGDFFLDQYLLIDPDLDEPSVETGLTAHQVVGRRQSPGAAGTVINNLASLEAGAIKAVGIIGDDGQGYVLRRELEARGVDTDHLLAAPDRFTPTYTKPMRIADSGEIEGERIDIINRSPTPPEWEDEIVRRVESVASTVDAIVLLDQVTTRDAGVLTHRVREKICQAARRFPGTLFYADSRSAIGEFRNVILKPNDREALRAIFPNSTGDMSEERVLDAGQSLFQRTGRPVFLTRGEKGMLVTSEEGQCMVPAFPVRGPIDVCGAGDSATAGLVLALCSGASAVQAAFVGNLVASKTVVQIGTTGTTTRSELLNTFPQDPRG